MRQVLRLEQGSEAWKAHRNTPGMINGSEIAAIMGLSSYVTRAEILRRKATGIEPEHDAATLARFAKGHKYEALARPLAEALIDDDLSALVITDTIDGLMFSVSLDGITQGNDITHEHKYLNQALAAALDAGYLPDEYHPQCESGLMVSGATRCLFMASKWDDDDNLIEEKHIWYESNPELRARMIAACKQFEIDRINYVHVEQTVAAVAAPIEALPALAVSVTGQISLVHNLDRFGKRLTEFVGGLNTKPQTDQDFVDLDAAVKVLKEAEAQLDAAESNALAQTTTIADMQNLVAMYRKVARDNRLMFEKIVKQEKENRRAEIVNSALMAFGDHLKALTLRIGGNWIPDSVALKFRASSAEAVKGLKSLDSMRDKVSTALANAKIEANEVADRIEFNSKQITVDGANYNYLVHDFAQICTKPTEDFAAIMAQRIAAHKAAEAEKAEAAKDAEEARIAAAVEAERKAGEARAAAAIEAERMAEAKRVADGARNALKEAIKGDVLEANAQPIQQSDMGQSLDGTAVKSVRADHSADAGNMVDAAMITEFIALQACSPAAKKEMRAAIEKWELYRLKMLAARGLAEAA
jgi:predicted phage-related endonuclease